MIVYTNGTTAQDRVVPASDHLATLRRLDHAEQVIEALLAWYEKRMLRNFYEPEHDEVWREARSV